MGKGAKKGENRFKASQSANIQARLQRIRGVVIPRMKTYLDLTHFKNKTKFQEMCVTVFNEDLPVNMKQITRRTIANSPYWKELGPIFYKHYDNGPQNDLEAIKEKALNSFSEIEKRESLEQEISNLTLQNEALAKAIGEAKLSPKTLGDNGSAQQLKADINDLICVIDFLIKASEGIVIVNREDRSITNLADDLQGDLSSKFAKTYFKHVVGGNE